MLPYEKRDEAALQTNSLRDSIGVGPSSFTHKESFADRQHVLRIMNLRKSIRTIAQVVLTVGLITYNLKVVAQGVPQLINYQGQLLKADGTFMATADYQLTFNVYDQAQGGNMLWGPQVLNSIPVVQGYFNVMLGPIDGQRRPVAQAFSGSTAYVEIQVGSNSPISPRQQILSAPYAFKAANADNATNADKLRGYDWSALFGTNNPVDGKISGTKLADASITGTQIASGSITSTQIASGSITGTRIAPLTVTAAQIAGNTITSNQIADLTITAAKLSRDLVLDAIIPPGSIIAYGHGDEPLGWLRCDGRPLLASAYPRLFNAIGYGWGGVFKQCPGRRLQFA